MRDRFDCGAAFICEGETEKEFYHSLLEFLCEKRGAQLQRHVCKDDPGIAYCLQSDTFVYLIQFYISNAISSLPKSGKWFETQCLKKYSVRAGWDVFLCYDTDGYQQEISPFYEGDWKDLRKKLRRAKNVVDLAAAADIEDVLLTDLTGICAFLNCPVPLAESLKGRKGAVKMKMLFRSAGQYYHKGQRARALIDALDKQTILDSGILPFHHLERLFPE